MPLPAFRSLEEIFYPEFQCHSFFVFKFYSLIYSLKRYKSFFPIGSNFKIYFYLEWRKTNRKGTWKNTFYFCDKQTGYPFTSFHNFFWTYPTLEWKKIFPVFVKIVKTQENYLWIKSEKWDGTWFSKKKELWWHYINKY